MKIIVVDDDESALDSLLLSLRGTCSSENPVVFRKSAEALTYISENGCDVVFLEIRLKEETGLVLAKKLRKLFPMSI